MVPSSTASNSIVALSVSISASRSPAETVSPSLTSHFASVPASMVGESAGIWMLMAIAFCCLLLIPQGGARYLTVWRGWSRPGLNRRHSRCRFLPPGPEFTEMRTYLVVIDETKEAGVALRFAARRAAKTGGAIHILALIPPAEFVQWGGVQATIEEEAHQRAEALLAGAAGSLMEIGR